MTYAVSGGTLNPTRSLTDWNPLCFIHAYIENTHCDGQTR